jgi:hypothetical protein
MSSSRERRTPMAEPALELEGTWEEIAARAPEFAGRRVRLIVLPEEAEEPYPGIPPEERPSTARSLLKYAGTWVGDDLQERLREVYANRSKAKF